MLYYVGPVSSKGIYILKNIYQCWWCPVLDVLEPESPVPMMKEETARSHHQQPSVLMCSQPLVSFCQISWKDGHQYKLIYTIAQVETFRFKDEN